MIHPINYDSIENARAHHRKLLQEAQQYRLAEMVSNSNPSFAQRTAARAGDVLIALGQRLKAYSTPAPRWHSQHI